ncbi:ABC transporter permease [Silvibacterium acidisoli]|uniref:ABC transporter permease n=1 Tax=Acidobacteriaceae bacterium ZG23-2 TaxID=2883246 RepID=UPI00406C7CDD
MVQDILYALRQLRKSPGFAVTAILTLALGIGATTAIFTLVHAVLLKSLPVAKPEELYKLGNKTHCCVWGGYSQSEEYSIFSYELYRYFRDHTPAFSDLAAFQGGNESLSGRRAGSSQPAQPFNGEFVSGNFFRTFGVQAWAGRMLNESDDHPIASPAAVMSFHVWQQKFGSDPAVIGSTYQLNGKSFTVVGVAAPGFFGAFLGSGRTPDFWLPLQMEPMLEGASSHLNTPDTHWLEVIGRVRPGTDPRQLESQLKLELRQWLDSHAADMPQQTRNDIPKQTLHLAPGGAGITQMREDYGAGLKLLLAASGCVLLIACANLANLLLARGLGRKQELSVRMALGASRPRLVKKAIVESLLLSALGGLAGIGVAYAGTTMILHLAFRSKDYVPIDAAPSPAVLLFAFGASLLTGVLFSLAPAWITTHAEPVEAMRGANRAIGANGPKAALPQRILVMGQAVMSLVLLSSAAMLSQSLHQLHHQNFGFETRNRYIVWLDPREAGYKPEQLENLFERLQERFEAIPGVHAVGESLYAPMSGDSWNNGVSIEGRPPNNYDEASMTRVGPGFFEAIGDRIVMGRPITKQDTAASRKVVVINQAFAKKFFKNQSPIGQHFGLNSPSHAGDWEIVGVASDARYVTGPMNDPIRQMFFVPETQSVNFVEANQQRSEVESHYLQNIVLWASGTPANLNDQVRHALADVDPNLVLQDFTSYDEVLSLDFSQQNMIAQLTSLFGGLALVLAAIGLYGVMSYAVEQRRGEIGIRMALGADRVSVVKMVMRNAFTQIAFGLALGVPAAIGAGYAIANQLFAVKPYSPVILGGAALLLSGAALIAAAIPAQRASSVEPMEALRAE